VHCSLIACWTVDLPHEPMVSMRSSDVTPWLASVVWRGRPPLPPAPALAAWLADHVWRSEEIVALLD
jgi:hypothetical protein